jgi:hypothetical protein
MANQAQPPQFNYSVNFKQLVQIISASLYKLIFFVFIEMNELVSQVVTHITCIWELPKSNISQNTSYPS